MDVKEQHSALKAPLVIASLLSGVLVGLGFESILLGIAIALVYPFMGAVVVWLCEILKSWAYRRQCNKWGQDERLLFAAVWPIALIVCVIMYIFVGIIHRLF